MQRIWKSEVSIWIGGTQDLASPPCEVVDDESAEASDAPRRRPPQRRESTKLQSATKFLRSLRAGRGGEAAGDVASGSGAAAPDRSSPHYHSQGKAGRRRAKQAKTRGDATAERSHSFHDKVSGSRPPQLNGSDHRRHDSLDSDVTLSELSPAAEVDNDTAADVPPGPCLYENVPSSGRADLLSSSRAPLQRDRERRSARKLTKDSGYETSPYSEGDYISLSLRSGSVETLTAEAARPPPLQQYLTEEYLTGVDTSRPTVTSDRAVTSDSAVQRRASLSEGSELGSVGSGSTLVAERSADDGRSSSSGGSRVRSPVAAAVEQPLSSALHRAADVQSSSSSLHRSELPASSTLLRGADLSSSSLHRASEQPSASSLHRGELPRAYSQSTPSLPAQLSPPQQQQQHGLNSNMVYNYAAAAAPAAASNVLWDEERERQAYAAHLRSSSYQLHSRQRSALGSSHSGVVAEAPLSSHGRQGSGVSSEDDALSHASFPGLFYTGDTAPPARSNSGGSGDCRSTAAGYSSIPEFRKMPSHDSLPGDVPPPPPPPMTSLCDAASDNTSLQGDGESLTYDLDDIDRALASDVPERDPASLTHIRYGPGHEKYPSWPVPAAAEPESGPLSGGSYRSKSWTDATDYPKDRHAGYTRPHAKKSLSATFQQQLNTVMEKCEKIGPESFLAPEQRAKSESPRDDASMFPCMDRDGRELGDKDYNIPSPPERDYDERIERRPTAFTEDVVGPRSLCTPFLDQLRRDIELSPVEDGEGNDPSWTAGDRADVDQQPRSGRDSVATVVTYSSSNSSNEAMRLYGSFSDISVMSSSTSRSDPHPDHQIAHSSRVRPPQRLLSENVLGGQQQQRQRPEFKLAKSVDESILNGAGGAPQDVTDSRISPKSPRSPAIDYSKPPSVTDRIKALESQSRESRRDLHSKSVPNLLADKWSWKSSPRLDSEGARTSDADITSNPSVSRTYRSGRSLDQTASDRDRDLVLKEMDGDGARRRIASRSVSSERSRVAPMTDTETRRKSFQVGSQDASTLKAIQKQAVMSYYERQMSRTATSPSHSTSMSSSLPASQLNAHPVSLSHSRSQNQSSQSAADCQTSAQSHTSPTADPKVPEKHERGYRAGPTLWRVPESLQPDSARPRMASGMASRSRGPARRSSSASDRTNISTSTNSSSSSSHSHSSGSRSGAETTETPRASRNIKEAASADIAVCSSSTSSSDGQPLSIQSSAKSGHSRSSSRDEQPPERPPKKPHLRALSGGAAPQVASSVQQQVVAGTATALTHAPSVATSSDAAPPPRRPPKSPCIRKPAMPEPATVATSRTVTASPELPPPPPPPPALNESLNVSDEPLPPPPAALLEPGSWPNGGAIRQQPSPPLPPHSPTGSQKATYHKDSYMAHRREWKFGYEGRYRRTLSPSPPPPATQEPPSPSPPPPPPPATAPPTTIGRSVSYAAPRSVEPTPTKLKSSTSTGRLSEAGTTRLPESNQVVRQPSTTVVFTDAELRAFRTRERRAKEMHPATVDDKENQRLSSPDHTSPLRQTGDSAPQHRSPSPPPPAVYRSPMADAKSERFSAYKKYSEIKPNCKPVVSPPSSLLLVSPSAVSPEPAEAVASEANPADSAAPPRTAVNGDGNSAVMEAVEDAPAPAATPATTGTLGRRKTAEEIECERLSKAFVSRAAVDNKLQNLLVPGPEHRTSAHYIQGLFDLPLTQAGSRTPAQTNGVAPAPASPPALSPDKPPSETSPLRPDSAYFTTSASKAKFLTQYARDVSADQSLKNVKNLEEVRQQQEELVSRISRKLEILRSEQQAVRLEIATNAALGDTVAARVQQLAAPAEADKYATYVEQIGTITSLLLGLSGRLARAENALGSLSQQDTDERANLITKRDKLSDQLEEARKLKESVDRRSRQVATMLTGYLSEEELSDYHHFIQMKAKLIIDSREIEDKLRLGEEQLAALEQT